MSRPLKIVADAHIWGVKSAFAQLNGISSELTVLENREISHERLMETDILLTRSSTKVNAELLQGTPVCFAATATIGDDHYDKGWLDANGITWANAAGSSTGSVIEYMASLLLFLHQKGYIFIPSTTIGIVGAGRIGTALAEVCTAIGMKVLINDPPRAKIEGDEGFSSLDELLEQADLVTLHTPMIKSGENATWHLMNKERLARFRGNGLINAARGGCVDNTALLKWMDSDHSHFAALDCWEFEPSPLQSLIQHPQMVIATPHIAGHSLDGKASNTLYVYRTLCRFLDIDADWNMELQLPPSPLPLRIQATGEIWDTLFQVTSQLYPMLEDHQIMKSWSNIPDAELANAFSGYRRNYPERRAWFHCPVRLNNANAQLLQIAHALGIKIV